MVYFRDISSSDKKYLVISNDQGDATEKGLSLLVGKPVIGRFSPVWPRQNDLGDIVKWTFDTSQNPGSPSRAWSLRTSLHKNTTESGPLRTLGRRIISGETRWGTIFRTNGTFKVASLMAIGRPFSLAIPVLTSFYRGLNKLARSPVVGSTKACLPMHYIYGWLGHYFDTHHGVTLEVIGPKMVRFSGAGGARYYDEYEAQRLIQGNHML
ncbi:hypothetical protein CMV_024674 [Castanea mollissima]|uniref:Uncharacterized protein n=1 Tax=Castanea mollissima TaxID=60419 RepID=A0A8J4VHP1_9ROSI|nr:hypothetical protein CMV_024674 [Castanea mollissima]